MRIYPTGLAVFAVALMMAGFTQAGTLIVGKDRRGTPPGGGFNDTNSLKAYDTLTGELLWEVDAGIAAVGGEIDQNGNLVVSNAGPEAGGTDNVTRYDVSSGAATALYNHGIGFAQDIAIHPNSGNIYHTAETSPPGHHGTRRFDPNGGSQTDLSGLPGWNSMHGIQFHQLGNELLLFAVSHNMDRPIAVIVDDSGTDVNISGQYPAAAGQVRHMTFNQNNGMLYASSAGNSGPNNAQVYEWNPADSGLQPVKVVDDQTNLQGAAGLAFDELNNLYVTESFGDGNTDLGDSSTKTANIYKYTPNAGTGLWDFDSLFATIEDTHVFNNGGGTFLQYVQSAGPAPTDFDWALNAFGNWTLSTSWNPQIVPGVEDDVFSHTVTFGSAATETTTAVVNSSVTVNRISFNNANQYIIAGGGVVNLAATTVIPAENPVIEAVTGDHQFQAVVNLLSDTTAHVASGLTLTFNNALDLGGQTLTKSGAGTLAINNRLVTSGGGSLIAQDGAISGHGTIDGDVNNTGGTISPGSSNANLANQVPEPASWILVIAGVAGVGLRLRRRK